MLALVLSLAAAVPVAPSSAADVPVAPGTKVYTVPSGAMLPTIAVGQNVLVRRYPDPQRERPAVGSIVIAHPPRGALAADGDPRRECGDREAMRRGRPCPLAVGGRSRERYVKRIVAGPGDTIAVRGGQVVRNGVPVAEPYTSDTCRHQPGTGPCNLRHAIRLPLNRYFLMGDNRGESSDSRFWGPIPRAWMIGEVIQIGVPPPPPPLGTD